MLEGGGIGCERTRLFIKGFAFYCVYVGSLLDTVTVPISDMALEGVRGCSFQNIKAQNIKPRPVRLAVRSDRTRNDVVGARTRRIRC